MSVTLPGIEFTVNLESQPGTARLRLWGELDLATVPKLEEALDRARRSNPVTIVVDLADLTFIGGTGLRVLVAAHRQATMTGRSFKVTNPDRMARRLMQLTHTTFLFEGPGAVSGALPGDTRPGRR
jgi:anti-anti-sigma factor